MFANLKLWAAGIGMLLLGFLVTAVKVFKKQRDSARDDVSTLKGTIKAEKKTKEIVKEEEEQLVSRRAELIRQLRKEDEDFKGLDNLNDPNNF